MRAGAAGARLGLGAARRQYRLRWLVCCASTLCGYRAKYFDLLYCALATFSLACGFFRLRSSRPGCCLVGARTPRPGAYSSRHRDDRCRRSPRTALVANSKRFHASSTPDPAHVMRASALAPHAEARYAPLVSSQRALREPAAAGGARPTHQPDGGPGGGLWFGLAWTSGCCSFASSCSPISACRLACQAAASSRAFLDEFPEEARQHRQLLLRVPHRPGGAVRVHGRHVHRSHRRGRPSLGSTTILLIANALWAGSITGVLLIKEHTQRSAAAATALDRTGGRRMHSAANGAAQPCIKRGSSKDPSSPSGHRSILEVVKAYREADDDGEAGPSTSAA